MRVFRDPCGRVRRPQGTDRVRTVGFGPWARAPVDPHQVGKLVAVAGIVFAAFGLLLWAGHLSWFGHLPGDIRIESAYTPRSRRWSGDAGPVARAAAGRL